MIAICLTLVLAPATVSTRASRLRRWAIIAASAFALYNVVGFFVLPPIVRSQIVKRGTAALDRPVVVERVRMNPLSWVVAIHGLRVVDQDGSDLVSLRELYVNADPLVSLAKLEWHLHELRLVEPRKHIVIAEDGTVNVAPILARLLAREEPAAEAPGEVPSVGIDEMRIERWSIEFVDRSRRSPFQTVIGPMTFTLDHFTTRRDAASPYTFAGTTSHGGESFSWSGKVSAVPVGSEGHIELSGFSIPRHMPFLEPLFNGSVKSGRVSFAGDYRLLLSDTPVMTLERAVFAVDDLAVAERGAQDSLIKLGRLQVDLERADGLARTAQVSRVSVDGLEVYATREADGSIDLLRLLPAAAEPAQGGPAPSQASGAEGDPGPAPSVHVAEFAVSDGRISLVDRSNARSAWVLLDQVALKAANLGTDLDREVAVEMSARFNERGSLGASGTVRARPFAATLEVKGADIDVAPLDPFVEPFADVRLKSGEVWFEGTTTAALAASSRLALGWTGDAGIDALSACEGRGMTELVGWKQLALRGTRFQLEPLVASAQEVALVDPTATLALDENGTVNILAALRRDAAPAAVEPATRPTEQASPAEPVAPPERPATTTERIAAATQPKLDFDATVDAVTISGGRFRMVDRSFKPGFETELRDFGGSIKGLSSANLARADVDLSGSLDGVAPLRVSGQINPLAEDVYTDLTVAFSNIDLPMFSPYSGRFLGQKIQKGKLRLDLGYKLSQRHVQGTNSIVFDQFYLGERVASEEAIKLPIGLALKLLRNREGKIVLDPDVSGSLDDPDFSYGRIIWRTIGNLVVKAATSPFSLLGSLIPGAGDKDLSYADFASGSGELRPAAQEKVRLLAQALFERPELTLEISSPPSPSTDRGGLVARRFEEMLRAEKQRVAAIQMPSASSEHGDAADAVPTATAPSGEVAPEETDALVVSLFAQTFPDEADAAQRAAAAAGMAPAGTSAPAEESDSPGLLRRTWRRLFGGGAREQDEAREEGEPAKVGSAPAADAAPGSEAAPALTLETMRERLVATIEIGEADYAALARARAAAIRDALLASGQVAAERIFVVDTATVPEGASGSPEGGRVFFGLQ